MFGRGQGIAYGGIPKLLAPEISLGGNYVYDKMGRFYSTTKVYGYIKKKNCNFSYLFLLGLLNSSLFWFFIRNTGYILRGGYFTFKTNYVAPFPTPRFEEIDKNIIVKIENEVDEILKIKSMDSHNDISLRMKKIDRLISVVYGLSETEIEIIHT